MVAGAIFLEDLSESTFPKQNELWLALFLHRPHQSFCLGILKGSVEKSRQRRSRHFSVLTYGMYALRAKMAAAFLDGLF